MRSDRSNQSENIFRAGGTQQYPLLSSLNLTLLKGEHEQSQPNLSMGVSFSGNKRHSDPYWKSPLPN
jgi:hypothetical protein